MFIKMMLSITCILKEAYGSPSRMEKSHLSEIWVWNYSAESFDLLANQWHCMAFNLMINFTNIFFCTWFIFQEERLGHRREKHSSHQYHCIICNKIFDEKWHYGHHIKSLVHRNNREIYRRAINIMKSCIGLDLGKCIMLYIDIKRCGMSAIETTLHPSHNL